MIEADNRALALIVYGSYAPGGENHGRLAFFAGQWRQGFILAARHSSEDDIGPGEDLIDAWVLEFPHPQEDRSSPQYEAWLSRLGDLWAALDAVMGKAMLRDGWQWCPRECNVTDDGAGTVMANIYLPRERFARVVEEPSETPEPVPAEEADLESLWRQTFAGERDDDHGDFIGLIREADPDRFDDMFADLPDGGRFLERLKRLFADHRPLARSTPTTGEDNTDFHPLVRNARPRDVLVELARRDIAQRASFLRARGKTAHAEALENLTFTTGKPDHPDWEGAAAALDAFADELRSSGPRRPGWLYGLKEACHGIAADYALQDWLLLFLLQPDLPQPRPRPRGGLISKLGLRRDAPSLDLEPAYALWKAGGRYEIDGATCCVYEVERREG